MIPPYFPLVLIHDLRKPTPVSESRSALAADLLQLFPVSWPLTHHMGRHRDCDKQQHSNRNEESNNQPTHQHD